jgi:hypothetical protein
MFNMYITLTLGVSVEYKAALFIFREKTLLENQ